MKKIILDNFQNDKTLKIELPEIPRRGDWIKIEDEDFNGGENYLTVKRVIFTPEDETIVLIVDHFDV